MIKRVYEHIKDFITENYLVLLLYLVIYVTLTYPLPYYIYTSGGLINVDSKISISNKTKSSGSYNMCYVEQLQATIPTYLLSFFMKDWEVVSYNSITLSDSETEKDVNYRDKLYLDNANNNALISSFIAANKDYEVLNRNPIIIYVMDSVDTNLKIGDEIISIDNIKVNSRDDILDYLESKEIGTKINIKVKNNNKEYDRYSKVTLYENEHILGVAILDKTDIKTNPSVSFNFSKNEYGPSGGLIISLAIYDFLVEDDITNGLKISGTGTIDEAGNVGAIGGVKYKLKGAVKKKADVFFVPMDNYSEAIKIKKDKDYEIDVVGVKTLNDAINYLNNKRTLEN